MLHTRWEDFVKIPEGLYGSEAKVVGRASQFHLALPARLFKHI